KSDRIQYCLSESELQSCDDFKKNDETKPFVDLHSDGVLCLLRENDSIYVALEYEASVKTKSRYWDKLSDYYKHSSIPAIFYIAKSQDILRVVQSVDREIVKDNGKKFKFYYTELENVLEGSSELTFENLSGRIFKF
ncbi:MAG: hypothetical protein KDD45_02450, partial [Bdellovibrionales bacterium]|nr:hypothetical protein [Bdellovibrionales bacterium]